MLAAYTTATMKAKRGRPGSNRRRCWPAARQSRHSLRRGVAGAAAGLTSERSARLSYAPETGSAGGIRTHDLELMRLARTAAPLPRKSGWQESNLRSPAPEAGGVATLPYSQMNVDQYPRRDLNPQLPD